MHMFWSYVLDRVIPGTATGTVLGTTAYIKLHFEKSWPYWGRNKKKIKHDA